MKISDLIKELEELRLKGNKDIVFSQDEEGNGYMSKCFYSDIDKNTLAIMPYEYREDL